ncbi:Nodulin MtN3 family protein [Prunus dulcis]|uniref:Bidirectional sugar transporter SWEET n=1 Tax=Prunus dulcis TaxID=3755 RepID=A0A4Y1QZJ9_PRUDU|nr:Nodulin MtN3 family protein [Prunus dulcis]
MYINISTAIRHKIRRAYRQHHAQVNCSDFRFQRREVNKTAPVPLFKPGRLNRRLRLSSSSIFLNMAINFVVIFGLLDLISINVFVRILRRRSTEEFESVPYVSKLLNAYFWVYYGLIKPNSVLVATVNIFGAVVEIRIDAAGLLCSVFSMIAYASPLSAMKTVVALKSVEYMPFLLSFILFLNGGIWTLYAILAKDLFVGIPNGTGFLFGTAQLILYAIYWKPSKPPKQVSDDLEDQQHIREALIPASKPIIAE